MLSEPSYRVEVTPAKALIRMVFIGFWDDETANRFDAEMEQAMVRLARAGVEPGDYRYLADFRESAIQSAVMVERFQGFAANAGTRAKRIAVLAASPLQKMQTQRMAASYDHYRFYLPGEEAAAEAWLMSD